MFGKKKPISLSDCIDFYLADCLARNQSPRTIESKRSALNAFSLWCFQQRIGKSRSVTWEHLEDYRHAVSQYIKPNGEYLKITTQRNRLTVVTVFFRRLYRFEIIKDDPGKNFDLPRTGRQLPKGYLQFSEIEASFDYATYFRRHPIRDRAILEVYFATGIRRMELARLTLKDIDIPGQIVTINMGKGQHDRRVPIAQRACYWVEKYLDEERPRIAKLLSGNTLFLDDHGEAFREHQLTSLVSLCVQRAGIDKPGACNLYRHSAATLMHENGADLRYVQELLGHADISTTQVYTHIAINKLREVYAKTHPAAKP